MNTNISRRKLLKSLSLTAFSLGWHATILTTAQAAGGSEHFVYLPIVSKPDELPPKDFPLWLLKTGNAAISPELFVYTEAAIQNP
jgi:hypothetical protein